MVTKNILFLAHNGAHSTLLIVVICVAFIALVSGIAIARLRNNSSSGIGRKNSTDKHIPAKVCIITN